MIRSLLVASTVVLLAFPLFAADSDPCPCVPVTHIWTIRSCDTFDCAASEFTLSNGSGDYVIVPTSSTDVKWVVLQRVPSGTATTSDPTFELETFDGFSDASIRFNTVAPDLKPIIMSVTDGRFVIVARRIPEPRRRAVAR